MTRPDRFLVVAAWEPELQSLRRALADRPSLRRRLVARPVGVGLVEAGIGTAHALNEERPAGLIFVGTAGVYPGVSAAPGSAVVVRRLALLSSASLRGEGYFPAPLPVAAETSAALRRTLARAAALPSLDLACPLAITRSSVAARRAARQTGCALENLEAFAVARAAEGAGVPFAAVVGISNVVGPRAHLEWKAWAERASAAACAAVLEALDALRVPTRRRRPPPATRPRAPARRAPRRPA
jgi:nucleoside phosphorylase